MNRRLAGLPALGLVGEGGEDSPAAQLCNGAIKSASNLQSQYSKLDEILSAHAKSIKSVLDFGTELDDGFVNDLLGEVDSLTVPTARGSSKEPAPESPLQSLEANPSILDSSSETSKGAKTSGFASSFLKKIQMHYRCPVC
jgi:hypothetical protein